jgi:hypothetical protein
MNEARLRSILLVVAAFHLLLGALMFFAPGAFYDSLGKFPPENHHYIKDVATFYIALGAVLYVSVRRRAWRVPLLVFAMLEYGIHAVNHLVDVNEATSALTGWFDFFSLALITLLLAALATVAWRVNPEPDPASAPEPEQPGGE